MRRILSLLVTLASGVVIGAAAAPMTAADPGVKLTYRVYLGEILRDGNVIASNTVYLEPGWVAEQSAPYGTPILLARADVP
ncbi:Uncharacterised protein [Mycobacteroides abscessus subsp. abscessus]|nr:Uncharacterised protein [Mycobacteroides abscessus subsp. abscessus]